jgi:hypothetical protein
MDEIIPYFKEGKLGRKTKLGIFCILGASVCLWVGSYVLTHMSMNDWKCFPSFMTFFISGIACFYGAVHFFVD